MHDKIELASINKDIANTVAQALKEDIGSGDITAQLIPETTTGKASVITREDGILCGRAWVDEVYRQLDPTVEISWHVEDADQISTNQLLFEVSGSARSLLTGERTALNFLQTLSGTATTCRHFSNLIQENIAEVNTVKLLDTRKTIPGLRTAQKYAAGCGGCYNHRTGLYDAFLIKENHISACGSIAAAVASAKHNEPDKIIEVEVETLDEFQLALDAKVDIIMLDNFNINQIKQAVAINKGQVKIEVSGGLEQENIKEIAATGIDFISIGALTKHCRAIDLSFRLLST